MIKVIIGEKPQEEKPFPKLMISDATGGIFLFVNIDFALCLEKKGSSFWQQGEFSKVLDISCFTDYNEPITIQNA